MSANIRAEWEPYAAAVVPKHASEAQVRETQQAFYAGAFSMFIMAQEKCSQLSGEEAQVFMLALADELKAFANSVLTE